ncbi:adenylate/guanylate cyclase domain-containing protein [Ferrovibrio sp.]|uniref:adenylate/guanylate cyclase domain-containing protein n=1 Tax=Ferrovibrio sp. TaxID=1917215 RepID=UPI003D0E4FF6
MVALETPANDPGSLETWLMKAGLRGEAVDDLLAGFCRRLEAEGFALTRVHVSLAALHPLIRARSFTWQRDQAEIGNEEMPHRAPQDETQAWRESPFRYMLSNDVRQLHRRLVGLQAQLDFPVLHEFAAQGATDWLAYAFGFGWSLEHLPMTPRMAEIGMICSITTDRPSGFHEAEKARLASLLPLLALAIKATVQMATTRDVMAAYLGNDAARHVLSGDIRRGMAHRIEAAILYADLRGFTALADRLAVEPLVETLNAYFDCLGPAIAAEGGQVLKFLGDGLLASFQPEEAAPLDPAQLCQAALRAAKAGLAAVEQLNSGRAAQGLDCLQLDIALHLGDLMYGNVGTADRLDFTLIGAAVNEAARIENFCGTLNRNLLASGSFAAAAGQGGGMVSLGHHALRGVSEPREIFGC